MILNIFLILFTVVSCEKFRFDNYTLYKVLPKNENHIKVLQELQDTDSRYDFWTDPVPNMDFVSIMSSPENKENLENLLNINGINFDITMKNIQEAIDKERVVPYTRNILRNMQWNAYYTLDYIYDWLRLLAAEYPSITSIENGGMSYENREILGIKISHGSGRRAIFIEAGIHSREWISPSAACFIIDQLLSSSDAEIQAAANDFDWYIFPVTNPDGYVWSHDHFRLWRKNRRPFGDNFGADLNRNWNSNWLVSGASVDPATDIYAGPGPFSEPETRSLSTYIMSVADQIDLYLSFHSYSQLLLLPFGNSTQPYANYHDAINIGRRAMGALSVRYGTRYRTGNVAEAIYEATGGSIDWVKDHLNVPLVYCYEFRDEGQYGFLLPEDQILPNNLETMDSILDMIHQARRFGYMNNASGFRASILLTIASVFLLLNK